MENFSGYRARKVKGVFSAYHVSKVIKEVSFYQVTQCLPSHQWLPCSRLLRVISKDRASTPTECMTMSCTVVDVEYQKVTE